MARRTFFSFHYKLDVARAWIVRNSWVLKVAQGERQSGGFSDTPVFEASQRENDESLKRFLREGLENTSVICVLVGEKTVPPRWVRYEIFRSFMCGNGLLAVRINTIPVFNEPPCPAGPDPFNSLAFTGDQDRVRFREYMKTGSQPAIDVISMPLKEVRYDLGATTNHTLARLFPIYDWDADNSYANLGSWIESAEVQADANM